MNTGKKFFRIALLSLLFLGGGMFTLMAQSDIKELSEEAIEFSDLPQAVQDAFGNSEYADWEIEEVEKVETDKGTMYELEVENEDESYFELYFSPKGELVLKREESHSEGDDDHR
ncbi:PepSY-like domain-containing protein [Muricauda ruestringensis]|jgi:hypothetical protein|uniref:PepSY-like domain-containing protein n=1 Tax=Flagellimonas aurea TaxID=2915619 RepID=A0ABS3G666_9FLAO|nr:MULTISPECIES: PepSY-like domain-containing protein [Allomuricauda]MBO0354922.1 PepSY-like domain-containing protein [Allomuricauda aurea]